MKRIAQRVSTLLSRQILRLRDFKNRESGNIVTWLLIVALGVAVLVIVSKPVREKAGDLVEKIKELLTTPDNDTLPIE